MFTCTFYVHVGRKLNISVHLSITQSKLTNFSPPTFERYIPMEGFKVSGLYEEYRSPSPVPAPSDPEVQHPDVAVDNSRHNPSVPIVNLHYGCAIGEIVPIYFLLMPRKTCCPRLPPRYFQYILILPGLE